MHVTLVEFGSLVVEVIIGAGSGGDGNDDVDDGIVVNERIARCFS